MVGLKKSKEKVPSPYVVLKAREMLTGRGTWVKGAARSKSPKLHIPQRCLIQAVNDAGDGQETLKLVLETINDLYGPKGSIKPLSTTKFGSIPNFNDHGSTTKIHVQTVLDEAYKRAGGKETDVGTMQVMDPKAGDRHVHWDPTRPDEVEDAKASFDFLVREKGYFAYMVEEIAGKFKSGKQVKEFDPSIGRLILRPALVGG